MKALRASNRFLVAERDKFRLTLYTRPPLSMKFKIKRSYPIAVGMVGHETPRGLYLISSRSNCPSWTMPESDWVPEADWGKRLECGDPLNPIRYRWLGIYEGVGIHGIPPEEEDTIGHPVSHGCLRMHKDDVIELFPMVPKRTPIYIV